MFVYVHTLNALTVGALTFDTPSLFRCCFRPNTCEPTVNFLPPHSLSAQAHRYSTLLPLLPFIDLGQTTVVQEKLPTLERFSFRFRRYATQHSLTLNRTDTAKLSGPDDDDGCR